MAYGSKAAATRHPTPHRRLGSGFTIRLLRRTTGAVVGQQSACRRTPSGWSNARCRAFLAIPMWACSIVDRYRITKRAKSSLHLLQRQGQRI